MKPVGDMANMTNLSFQANLGAAYRDALLLDVTPFWLRHGLDREHGEWLGYLHRDGPVSQRAKGNMFKGPFHLPRMMWYCWRLCEAPGVAEAELNAADRRALASTARKGRQVLKPIKTRGLDTF